MVIENDTVNIGSFLTPILALVHFVRHGSLEKCELGESVNQYIWFTDKMVHIILVQFEPKRKIVCILKDTTNF